MANPREHLALVPIQQFDPVFSRHRRSGSRIDQKINAPAAQQWLGVRKRRLADRQANTWILAGQGTKGKVRIAEEGFALKPFAGRC